MTTLIRTSGAGNEPFPTPAQLYQQWAVEDAIRLVRRLAQVYTVESDQVDVINLVAAAKRLVIQIDDIAATASGPSTVVAAAKRLVIQIDGGA